MKRVAYTDPAWALDGDGHLDVSLGDIEREVYSDDICMDLGLREDGEFVLAGSELASYAAGADALVVYRCQVTPELLAAAHPTCKVVARQGVGLDNLNMPLLADANLYGFHVPDYCGDEVSTHAVALLLALERGVCVQDRLVKANRWSIHSGGIPRRTCERTVGIIGFGRIGRATARKLNAIYDSILAYDPYVSADLMASFGVRKVDDLAQLLSGSHAVLVHAELTAETQGLLGAASLAHAQQGVLLVNTARGKLVDATAVLDALRDGRLGGFASDVFSPEDPNESEDTRALLEREDVIVTAHRAFLSTESERSLRRRVAEGVAHVLRTNEPPLHGRVV
jgi:D-3-phosphoglycerate dehydrogenase